MKKCEWPELSSFPCANSSNVYLFYFSNRGIADYLETYGYSQTLAAFSQEANVVSCGTCIHFPGLLNVLTVTSFRAITMIKN